MNFSEQSIPQDLLPGFSELNARGNTDYVSSDTDHLSITESGIYTTVAADNNSKDLLVNSPNKYSNNILAWTDPGALIQICSDKQNVQAINIPVYNQSDTITIKTVSDVYLPQMESEHKHDNDKDKNQELGCNSDDAEILQSQSLVMQEYLQKLQSSSLPLTLQQLIKIQNEQAKKDKAEEEQKNENNILNIPTVQTGLIGLNPSDVNVHYEEQADQTNQNNLDAQKEQTEGPKTQGKKFKFKAKTGEIKVTIGLDGSTLYCCPECSLVFAHKPDIEQHLQVHIQERKYQCKECGAMLKRKEHLDQHMRGHSDERPFKCPVCSKGFKRNEHLTRHYVIHSGDKNFTCTVCQKAFSRKDHLTKHSQTHLGIKKSKVKKEVIFLDTKDNINIINNTEKVSDSSTISREEINSLLKESNFFKQDSTFLHHIQNLQKETNYMQSFSAFREHILKDSSALHQQAVNMNEILPQNTRYLMPS